MHLHGSYGTARMTQDFEIQSAQVAAQRRADEARRRTAASLLAMGEQDGWISEGSAQEPPERRRQRSQKDGEEGFAHIFSALG